MVRSDIETECSSDKNDSLASVIKNDAVRYRRKGYGLVIAVAIAFSYFYFVPDLLHALWPSLISLASNSTFYVASVLFLNVGVLSLTNLMMMLIYKAKLPFFQKYRISNNPWPWEENPQKWKTTLVKTLKGISFNILLVQLPVLILDTKTNFAIKFGSEEFPGKLIHIQQIILFMVVEDFTFFMLHWALHSRLLYKIHKTHHEYNTTISLAAEYSHPLEFLFSNIIPTGLGYRILSLYYPVHMSTVLMWLFVRVWETTDGHCGYEWSWSVFRLLPMSGSAEYHGFHHSHNVGNYSSFFTIWDTIFGTNKYYFEHKCKKQREAYLNKLRLEYAAQKKKNRACSAVQELSD